MKSLRALKSFDIRKKRRGLLRVFAYFTFVWLVCCAVSIRHAHAEYTDQALELGRQMAFLAKATHNEQTTVLFNGQKIRIGNVVSQASPAEVLKRYEEYCKGSTSAFLADGDGPKDQPSARAGFIRLEGKESDGDGGVICFVRGPESKPTRKEAFEAFIETGKLGALGELRYAYAKKTPSGRTHVITAWTDSSFNLLQIAPRSLDEDVAGGDLPEIPRAPQTTRIIAASAEGTPYAMNVYRSKQTVAQVVAFYDEKMQAQGWFKYDPEIEETDNATGRGYFKQGVVVTLGAQKEDDGTYFSLGLSGVGHEEKIGRVK